jgi:hypothetical protein
MNIVRPLLTALVAASLALAGCSSAPGQAEEVGTAQQASMTFNSLTFNSLTFNSLTFNSLTFNSLTFNSLTFNSLTFNQLLLKDLEDPTSRDVFSYIVGCALPASETISLDIQGVTYNFPGDLGLAREWGTQGGSCGGMCQEWVSACVISRLDYAGVKQEISLRGQNRGLGVTPSELAGYPNREATYFGNIFTSPMKLHGCLSPGQTGIPRVCGSTLEGCGVDVDASCDQVCEGPTKDGAFVNCRPGDGDWDDFPYHGSITVYLP